MNLSANREHDLRLRNLADRQAASKRLGWELGYSDFIASGKWNVDDVLRPIYQEASEVVGREFVYPADEDK